MAYSRFGESRWYAYRTFGNKLVIHTPLSGPTLTFDYPTIKSKKGRAAAIEAMKNYKVPPLPTEAEMKAWEKLVNKWPVRVQEAYPRHLHEPPTEKDIAEAKIIIDKFIADVQDNKS